MVAMLSAQDGERPLEDSATAMTSSTSTELEVAALLAAKLWASTALSELDLHPENSRAISRMEARSASCLSATPMAGELRFLPRTKFAWPTRIAARLSDPRAAGAFLQSWSLTMNSQIVSSEIGFLLCLGSISKKNTAGTP